MFSKYLSAINSNYRSKQLINKTCHVYHYLLVTFLQSQLNQKRLKIKVRTADLVLKLNNAIEKRGSNWPMLYLNAIQILRWSV
jgi:hypothetical protein